MPVNRFRAIEIHDNFDTLLSVDGIVPEKRLRLISIDVKLGSANSSAAEPLKLLLYSVKRVRSVNLANWVGIVPSARA